MKYNQELPVEVEAKLDAYIERIKNIKWFQPKADISRDVVDTAVKASLSAFGIEQQLREHLMVTLPEGERKVLMAVLGGSDDMRAAVSKEHIAIEANYKGTSTREYVRKLAARKLVYTTNDGLVAASDKLF